jgi:hypothetical protein
MLAYSIVRDVGRAGLSTDADSIVKSPFRRILDVPPLRVPMRAWCWIVLCAATLSGAAAGEAKYPAAVDAVLEEARKSCVDAGGKNLKLGPKIVRKLDLTGDGRADYIIDLQEAECDEARHIYCGTGGCELVILVAKRDGSFVTVFEDTVRGYSILPGRGARSIRFRLHGGFCGRAGPDPCAITRRIADKPIGGRQ